MKKQLGFTLIEVMIVVVIVGILASIAYPSYRNYVLRANRAEGAAHILRVLQAQERHHSQNMTYTTTLSDLGINPGSETGRYTITATGLAACGGQTIAQCVTVTATAATADPVCNTMSMDSRGAKNPTACW